MYESPSDSTDGYLQRTLPPPRRIDPCQKRIKVFLKVLAINNNFVIYQKVIDCDIFITEVEIVALKPQCLSTGGGSINPERF